MTACTRAGLPNYSYVRGASSRTGQGAQVLEPRSYNETCALNSQNLEIKGSTSTNHQEIYSKTTD